jgi:hypothetical protein
MVVIIFKVIVKVKTIYETNKREYIEHGSL